MATLPMTASWAMDIDTGPGPITNHGLVLYDADGRTILEFVEPSLSQTYSAVQELTALVNAQQRQIKRLTKQVAELRK